MTQRITNKHLEAKIAIVNGLLGYEDPAWNTVGAVHLYGAYGGTGVHRTMNEQGGVEALFPLGTKRETATFLDGMITGLRTV